MFRVCKHSNGLAILKCLSVHFYALKIYSIIKYAFIRTINIVILFEGGKYLGFILCKESVESITYIECICLLVYLIKFEKVKKVEIVVVFEGSRFRDYMYAKPRSKILFFVNNILKKSN